jgi:hypothetical protein
LATSPTPQTAGKKPEIIYIFILPIKCFLFNICSRKVALLSNFAGFLVSILCAYTEDQS